jgi:hypothetical protein
MKKTTRRPVDGKKVLRETGHLTTPPRMEGVVKNAKLSPKKKKKLAEGTVVHKQSQSSYSDSQRKDYQLRSKKH